MGKIKGIGGKKHRRGKNIQISHKVDIPDEFVELFEKCQIFKNLPDFTKYTEIGVDNDKHKGEHYCCLINSLVQLGCDQSVLQNARTCITGLNVPTSALKKFCDIAKIRIKIYFYIKPASQAKKLKTEIHWDEKNIALKDAPLFNIGIVDNHYIPMLDINVSANAIKKFEEIKHKSNFWIPVKKQQKKDSLWLIHEMLDRKDQFFRDIPNDEAHMATLHFGSKKNLEYEGTTYDAPTVTPTEMQKANDDRKWKIIKKHIMSCDPENQTRLFLKNGFKTDGYELEKS